MAAPKDGTGIPPYLCAALTVSRDCYTVAVIEEWGMVRVAMMEIPYRGLFSVRLALLAFCVFTLLLAVPASSDASQFAADSVAGQTVGGPECMIEPWDCSAEAPECMIEPWECSEDPVVCVQEVGSSCPEAPSPPEVCIQEVGAPCPGDEPTCMIEPWECPEGGPGMSAPSSNDLVLDTAGAGLSLDSSTATRPRVKSCGKAKVRRGSRCVRRNAQMRLRQGRR